jgi:hypothetical protein
VSAALLIQGCILAKSKRSAKWRKNKEKVKAERIQKKNDFESSPLLKRAKKHALFGFIAFIIYLLAWLGFNSLNEEIPTGLVLSGVVIDWSADGPVKRHGRLKAKIKLENDFIFYISFSGRQVGEKLEFNEYKHRITGNFKYRLKNQ